VQIARPVLYKDWKKRNFDSASSKAMFDKAVELDSYKQLQDLVTGQAQGHRF
jgi:hypothetical protein